MNLSEVGEIRKSDGYLPLKFSGQTRGFLVDFVWQKSVATKCNKIIIPQYANLILKNPVFQPKMKDAWLFYHLFPMFQRYTGSNPLGPQLHGPRLGGFLFHCSLLLTHFFGENVGCCSLYLEGMDCLKGLGMKLSGIETKYQGINSII